MGLRASTLFTVLVLLLAACGRNEMRPASAAPAVAQDVRTVEVVRSPAGGDVTVPAMVEARRRAVLSARMSASVVELPYREGQSVAAGALVVRLDDPAVRGALTAAEAAVKAAESDLDRTKALLDKGAATPRELEQMAASASAARAQLTAAKDNLSYTALRSPFAGRVAARRVSLGDVVSPGAPLLEIEGDGGLELHATVEAEIATTLRPGSRVVALVDGQARPLAAVVTAVAPSGDPTTHRFELKADLPGTPGLRAGVFARLVVPGLAPDFRLQVPATALFERGGLTGLFVLKNDRARLRWVAAGARTGEGIEIRAGVEAGERVVVEPSGLTDGAPVRESQAEGSGNATAPPSRGRSR